MENMLFSPRMYPPRGAMPNRVVFGEVVVVVVVVPFWKSASVLELPPRVKNRTRSPPTVMFGATT